MFFLVDNYIMGNVNTVVSEIESIVDTRIDTTATANAVTECDQDVTLDFSGAKLKGCTFDVNAKQECEAKASITLRNVVDALAAAEFRGENKQHAEGIIAQMNVSTTTNRTRQEILTDLESECTADAEVEKYQTVKLDMSNTEIDCTGGNQPDYLVTARQYADASANCVVSKIVDAYLQTKTSSINNQATLGLFGPAGLAAIAAVLVLFALIGAFANKKRKKRGGAAQGPSAAQGPNSRLHTGLMQPHTGWMQGGS
tara:strand:+ start:1035 stop:1802 length:768 start_codon:yes stop_codon:yes gene_type:complete